MQLGHQHLQVSINAGLFALAIMAAFVCDLLRRKNQQLRELALALTVRNQESERREQILLARTAVATAQVASTLATANVAAQEPSTSQAMSPSAPPLAIPEPHTEVIVAAPHHVTKDARKQSPRRKNHRDRTKALSPDAAASIERGLQMATDPRLTAKIKKLVAQPQVVKPQVWQDTEALPKSDVVTELFERHAAKSEAAHARKSASARVAKPAIIAGNTIASIGIEARMLETVTVGVASSASPMAGARAQTVVTPGTQITELLEANKTSKKNWSALLSRQTSGTALKNELLDAVVAATAEPAAVQNPVPAGFYDGHVLSQIVRSNQPVSGLIVSIGVAGGVAGRVSCEAHTSIADLMRSLLGPTDFGCQSGDEEFLLIYPGERGASAQHRLSSIAQQLWNFQLRAMGQFEILFSWGGMEVRSESVETAIASAKDRMIETKRGRKLAVVNESGRHLHAA